MRDLAKDHPDGRGHTDQMGHTLFAMKLKEEIQNRWKISLILDG